MYSRGFPPLFGRRQNSSPGPKPFVVQLLPTPLSLKPHIHLCPEAMWSMEDDNHPGKSHLPSLTDSVLKAGQTFP